MVGWFEIPVSDMTRALGFYEKVFDVKLVRSQMGSLEMAWFPWNEKAVGAPGSLVCNADHYKPSSNGVVIYFTSQTGNLSDQLQRVENAGGKIVQRKTKISDTLGYMAVFTDTEGNKIAIHSNK
ncbi:MAG: VOC family protein [Ignavibacteria bacterium]|nr:VOC family protein [Ignavibacteria bacterium]